MKSLRPWKKGVWVNCLKVCLNQKAGMFVRVVAVLDFCHVSGVMEAVRWFWIGRRRLAENDGKGWWFGVVIVMRMDWFTAPFVANT